MSSKLLIPDPETSALARRRGRDGQDTPTAPRIEVFDELDPPPAVTSVQPLALHEGEMIEERRIGPYHLLEPLGHGGMGVVYRARHVTSQRAAALKTVHAAARFALDGIRREIVALTTIRHPGIVRIIDHGTHEGLPWYAMDLLEGESLRRFGQRIWSRFPSSPPASQPAPITRTDVLGDRVMTQASEREPGVGPFVVDGPQLPAGADELESVVDLIRRVCLTLAFLHGEGFVNCDLKPENVLLIGGAPVIIDFGLSAHHPGGSGRESLEVQRAMSGTLQYMSPEQIRGDPADARSDLYGVGCILYELVTGRPPFFGSPPTIMSQHLEAEPRPPSQIVRGVSAELERAILKLLAKSPSDRFGYADEVAAALADGVVTKARHADYPPGRAYLYRPGFVGRAAVMRELVALREWAAEGRGACVLIGGESGIGKTRLAMELTRVLPSSRMRVVTSEVPAPSMSGAGMSSTPLQAVRSMLLAIADACQEGGAEATERLIGQQRAVLALYEPLLSQVPALEPLHPAPPLPPEIARQRLFRYLWEAIAALAREQPLLWVIDDLGWADELSLSFLATLDAEYLERNRILIVATYRSEEACSAIDVLKKMPHITAMSLPRLEPEGVRSMVCDMLAMREPPEGFISFVTRQTEGNPFFVTEYLRGAVTDRIVFRKDETWRLPTISPGRDYESLPLPNALRVLVERRLKSLSPAASQVVLAAAVLGRESDLATLMQVAALPESTFMAAWSELHHRQVLEEPQAGRARFAHDKLREAAHAQAPSERLRELHARAGETLERSISGREDAALSFASLGRHFAAAQQAEKAARYLQLAADHARQKFANSDAIALYRGAIDHVQEILLALATDPGSWYDTLLDLYESLGDVLSLAAQRDDARAALLEALRGSPVEDSVRCARLHRKLGKTWEAQHESDALREYTLARSSLPAVAPASGDARNEWIQLRIEQLWAYYWLNRVPDMEAVRAELEPVIQDGATSSQRARFFHTQALQNLRRDRYLVSEETLDLAARAVAACADAGASPELPMVQFLYGFVLLFHGSIAESERELLTALEHARRAGDTAQQARCLTYVALAARRRDAIDDTAQLAIESANVAERAGMREYLAAAWANQAWVDLRSQRRDSARRTAEEAWHVWCQLAGVFPFRWMALLPLLELHLEGGELEAARQCVAGMLAPDQHALPADGVKALAQGITAFAAGHPGQAEAALRSALRLLDAAGYR